jgi:hypothetical protein
MLQFLSDFSLSKFLYQEDYQLNCNISSRFILVKTFNFLIVNKWNCNYDAKQVRNVFT